MPLRQQRLAVLKRGTSLAARCMLLGQSVSRLDRVGSGFKSMAQIRGEKQGWHRAVLALQSGFIHVAQAVKTPSHLRSVRPTGREERPEFRILVKCWVAHVLPTQRR